MSDQQLPQPKQQQRPTTAAIKTEVTAEDNFTAMRHAAMSMFKQRTKDLTMVSSLTAEAAEVEQLNAEVQAAIHRLQERKAAVEANIETEERRVREREGQLRAVHAALAQMTEDHGVFAGVRRSSEKVATALHHFVAQYTAKGGEAARLLDRSHERTQAKSPNEWRVATNDLRRRQAVLEEHVKHIEKHQTVPFGFNDMLLEWSHGVWKQQPECMPALHICEKLLCYDAAGIIHGLLMPPPVQAGETKGMVECEAYVDACIHYLNAIANIGTSIKKDGENVGLCCSVILPERAEEIRSRWNLVSKLRASLQEIIAASKDISTNVEEQLTLAKLLSERIAILDSKLGEAHSNIEENSITVQREEEMHKNLVSSWHKTLHTGIVHMQCEIAHQFTVESKEKEMAEQKAELEVKTREMEAMWNSLHSDIMQIQTALLLEEQEKAEALCCLKSLSEDDKKRQLYADTLSETCTMLESELKQECDEMDRGALSVINGSLQMLSMITEEGKNEKSDGGDADGEAEMNPSQATAINDFLQKLLQCGEKTRTRNENNNNTDNNEEEEEEHLEKTGLSVLMTSTGLEDGLLRCVSRCLKAFQQQVDHEVESHHRWKQSVNEELLILAAK